MYFSIIIPVYNRPQEVAELLESLCRQVDKDFEVVIVEDGSTVKCESIVKSYQGKLPVRYYYQKNTGQGFARNFGMEKARGEYFVFFDSDCVIPEQYFSNLKNAIRKLSLDAHGGPDAAAEGFSSFQKAINFSMTSVLTTGGIRGKLLDPKKYQARGYNMGFSRKVYETVGGFRDANKGEDIELSIRIKKAGFTLQLVKKAFVYHKRRNDFKSFLKQSYSFGVNRIQVNRYHPGAVKWVHLLPSFFLGGILLLGILYPLCFPLFFLGMVGYGLWGLAVFVLAFWESKSLGVGVLAIPVSLGQLCAYGAGLAFAGIATVLTRIVH